MATNRRQPRLSASRRLAASRLFQARVTSRLEDFGAILTYVTAPPRGIQLPSYEFVIQTALGRLDITVLDFGIHTRFEHPKPAHVWTTARGTPDSNPHSGKWNWSWRDVYLAEPHVSDLFFIRLHELIHMTPFITHGKETGEAATAS